MSEDEKGNTLSRWSKRKLAVQNEEPEILLSPEEEEQALTEQEALLEANREEAESIDLDTIDEDSDLSVFMKEGVPAFLKRQALSKLWKSSPIFANVDGLNDYDEDFGDESLIMKTFKSAYKAGSGYAKEVIEPEEEVLEVASAEIDDESHEEEIVEDEEEIIAEEEAAGQPEENDNAVTAEVHDNEMDEPEAEPVVQKVSLRRRLALDEQPS